MKGGIIREIMDLFSKEAKIDIVYKETSRKREEAYLCEGKVHIQVISNPEWYSDYKKFYWSIPLFTESDRIIVSAKKGFKVKSVNDLNGKRIGTIRGYYYTGLMEKFDIKEILREDVSGIFQNFRKLDAGRIDCFIDSDILIWYHLTRYNSHNKYIVTDLVLNPHDIRAVISKKVPVSMERINSILGKMKARGDIKAILSKYH